MREKQSYYQWVKGRGITYNFEAVRHRALSQAGNESLFEVVNGSLRGNEDHLVRLEDLEIQHRLELIVHDVDIEFQVLLA